MNTTTISGQSVTRVNGLSGNYSFGQVDVVDDEGNFYRMPVSTILQMMNYFDFVVEKKRKYNHLVEAIHEDEVR